MYLRTQDLDAPTRLGQPMALPRVTEIRFRNSGTTDTKNCRSIDLGVGAGGNACNGMELRFRISGHRAGIEYDITRTRRDSLWQRVAGQVREMRGVESVALAGWMPLSGNHWTGTVRVGSDPEPISPYLLDVSPGYFATMGIGWLDGRDFRAGDVQPRLVGDNRLVNGVGIVNEAFARQYFEGQNPVGKTIGLRHSRSGHRMPRVEKGDAACRRC